MASPRFVKLSSLDLNALFMPPLPPLPLTPPQQPQSGGDGAATPSIPSPSLPPCPPRRLTTLLEYAVERGQDAVAGALLKGGAGASVRHDATAAAGHDDRATPNTAGAVAHDELGFGYETTQSASCLVQQQQQQQQPRQGSHCAEEDARECLAGVLPMHAVWIVKQVVAMRAAAAAALAGVGEATEVLLGVAGSPLGKAVAPPADAGALVPAIGEERDCGALVPAVVEARDGSRTSGDICDCAGSGPAPSDISGRGSPLISGNSGVALHSGPAQYSVPILHSGPAPCSICGKPPTCPLLDLLCSHLCCEACVWTRLQAERGRVGVGCPCGSGSSRGGAVQRGSIADGIPASCGDDADCFRGEDGGEGGGEEGSSMAEAKSRKQASAER